MTHVSWLSRFLPGLGRKSPPHEELAPSEGYSPVSQDTLAAIHELSRAVRNNPDAVEIYLALGNLFRSQGEIERAVHIRESLIVRPGLDNRFKARAWFELGRDFKRAGFLDRAKRAFARARELWGDNEETLRELARLAAESGDFQAAEKYYERLDHPVAQAHYLVRLAETCFAADDPQPGRKWLDKSLAVYPGSVEAWTLRLSRAMEAGLAQEMDLLLRQALDAVSPGLRFLLVEGLLNLTEPADNGQAAVSLPDLRTLVLPALEERMPDLLLAYYGGMLLLRCREHEAAARWFRQALNLHPDFWPAHLELLGLGMDSQSLDQDFRHQLDFFIDQAGQVKRFVCVRCGIKRERIFHVCPRCHSWHSIAFRTQLRD